jgi:hypothetical protein
MKRLVVKVISTWYYHRCTKVCVTLPSINYFIIGDKIIFITYTQRVYDDNHYRYLPYVD